MQKWTAVAMHPVLETFLKDIGEGKSHCVELQAAHLVAVFAGKERWPNA
jgi:hypothetical protein